MKYLFTTILFFLSTPALAGFHVGSSIVTTGAKNLSPSYNIGYSFVKDDIVFDLTTNALFPVENKTRKRGYDIEYKVTYLSLSVGKKFDRFVPSLLVSAVKFDNSVFLGNFNVAREKSHAVVFGANFNYFITNRVATSVTMLLPNTTIDLPVSTVVGVNFYF